MQVTKRALTNLHRKAQPVLSSRIRTNSTFPLCSVSQRMDCSCAHVDAQSVGLGFTALRRGLMLSSIALRRRLLVSFEINNKDRAYKWFLAWLAHQSAAAASRVPEGRFSLWPAAWARSHQISVETVYEQRKNGSSSVLFKLVAAPGSHWVKYRGAWMQVRFPVAAARCSTALELASASGPRFGVSARRGPWS